MKYIGQSSFLIFMCICFIVGTLALCNVSLAEGINPVDCTDVPSIPTLDSEGAMINASESERKNLIQLFTAANPSDLLVSFDLGDIIDDAMFVAGFYAEYNDWADRGRDEDSDSDTFYLTVFDDDVEAYFADFLVEFNEWWNNIGDTDFEDEDIPPRPDALEYWPGETYFAAENNSMQTKIKGIYGRGMNAPEDHIRYYNGHFYFSYGSDVEGRFWSGYDYTIDNVYDLLNDYYKITGKAAYYHYADGELEDTKTYEALVKKDAAAEYTYFLIAQRFSDYVNTDFSSGQLTYMLEDNGAVITGLTEPPHIE